MSNDIVFVNGQSTCGCVMAFSDGGGEYSDVHRITLCAEHARGAREESPFSAAITDVLAERTRQQRVKGYTTAQDDTYTDGELAAAAMSYIEPMAAMDYWPADWPDDSFKPSDYRRNLIKATALLIAELERGDRAADLTGDDGTFTAKTGGL